ncbi:YSIRK-type signal peptide-containing protein [Lactobacillus crispatus]|uniref:mucin-binding protein n=1 Tax=Lactobacillus crispatus TaxID=47770 RepID=UPI003D6C0886
MLERIPKYTLRKLSVGLASVMIGSGILMSSPKVLAATNADTANEGKSTNTNVQHGTSNQNEGESNINGQPDTAQNVPSDTAQESSDKTPTTPGNNNETPSSKTKLAKALPGTPASNDIAPKPTTDKATTTTGVYNNPLATSSDWIKMTHGKAIGYYTAKGKDGKTYVTGYAAANGKSQSIFNVDQIDANSLEFHLLYHNGDKEVGSGLWFNFADGKTLKLDTSRLGSEGIQLKSQQGQSYKWAINTGADQGIYYNSWAEYLKAHNNVGDQASQISMTGVALKPDDTIKFVIPVKYTGQLSDRTQSLRFEQDIDDYGSGFNRSSASLYFTTVRKDKNATRPESPDAVADYTPATPTTDKAGVTTGVYNNPLATSSDWIKMTHGKAIGYYTAKGKDGKTYVTGYAAANSQSIFNVDQIDLNSLEFHLIYHNGDKEVGSGLWFNFADGKTLKLDTSRLGSEGIQLKSQQGQSYKWAINTGADQGIYYNSWAEYLKAHNNVGDQASQISMTGVALKPDDTIKFVIPVKYTGQLSDRTQSLRFEQDIDDYGSGFNRNKASLYFTTVRKDLSQVKQVDLLPTEFMGEQPGQSNWKLIKEIVKDMPNGREALKISNFPIFNGSFNTELPKGDLPPVVYGTAQYFIDLSQIQRIFANHGYTVKYANNNGKAQEMPFYGYVTLPLALIDGGGKPVDPSIWTIQVQAVPAIILNKDQHYVADPNAKPWDTTSMIDEIYAADDAGQRKTRDQLEKLPKTDVDISYEYQAPGASTAVAVDKVDLTKAGVYTVTYSHTYANKQVVKDSRKVYVDDVKQETKDITRTIIVHEPNGTDQTVTQKATLTREVILYEPTGKIKSEGEWSTAKWEAYSAPEFKGYTPSLAQIDETTVNENTQDTTVEISYTANEITKPETKDITRTIIVHTPSGTDQTVIQKATLTREVILYEPTGKIKSEGEWSTAKWEAYSAPEFKGYTPDKAQVDETTVNENTQDTTVEISYTANETPAQPDHSNDNSNNDNNGGNSGVIVPINPSANNSNNSNTAPTDNNTDTSKPTRTNRTDDISPKANVMNMTKRTTKSGTISPKAVALANTTAGLATSAKANMGNGIAKNNSQNSQTLPQTGENESKVAFAVAGLLAAALGIFGIAINRKKEN